VKPVFRRPGVSHCVGASVENLEIKSTCGQPEGTFVAHEQDTEQRVALVSFGAVHSSLKDVADPAAVGDTDHHAGVHDARLCRAL